MNIDELRAEIAKDEGKVNSVYLDHLSLKTVGIGHLVNEWDEEYDKPVGTPVSEERVNELFAKDIEVTCLLYTSPSPRDGLLSRMPSSA